MEDKQLIYFSPGDLVKCRHFEDAPVMYMVEKVTRTISSKEDSNIGSMFLGIKVRWFDKNDVLHEAIFNTKDLIKVE